MSTQTKSPPKPRFVTTNGGYSGGIAKPAPAYHVSIDRKPVGTVARRSNGWYALSLTAKTGVLGPFKTRALAAEALR